MSKNEAAQLLGLGKKSIEVDTESINPEAFATREDWIDAHPAEQRDALYAEWAEPDPTDVADRYNEECRAADAQG